MSSTDSEGCRNCEPHGRLPNFPRKTVRSAGGNETVQVKSHPVLTCRKQRASPCVQFGLKARTGFVTVQARIIMKRALAVLGIAFMATAAGQVLAEAFGPVTYDAKSDELVVTILYSGTNPDHTFWLAWNKCIKHPDGTTDVQAEVVDRQGRDAVSQEFKKTVRLSLSGLVCRPARVTLHSWPNSFTTVQIPASPSHQNDKNVP